MLKEFERKMWDIMLRVSPKTHQFVWPKRRAVKYIISGGTSAVVNLFFLYFFTDILGIWYIISAILSFSFAFVVSFIFQKFWTFEDSSTNEVSVQVAGYLLVTLINLCINTLLIYFFVEFFGIHYLIAQIIAGILIACESFFVYRKFIFRNK